MELIKIENLSFAYPTASHFALNNISLSIEKGEFVTILGHSGSGKSTLLKHLKPLLSPHGTKDGIIYFSGNDISTLTEREQCEFIGFVMQDPDSQMVTDNVYHELAFTLESLGESTKRIRTRVSELASFMGIEALFERDTSTLSGGQKQLVALASVLATNPSVILLDEPTSQLDPLSATNFISMLHRLNSELGTTIILTEHRLDDVFPLSDKTILMEQGSVTAVLPPREMGEFLKNNKNIMYKALPTPMRVHFSVPYQLPCPLTVREGKAWLNEFSQGNKITPVPPKNTPELKGDTALSVSEVYFRYEKNSPDVLKNLNFSVKKGELYSIVGGNGTGKTTSLSVIASLLQPYRGKVTTHGKTALLPQSPAILFTENKVRDDFSLVTTDESLISSVISLCKLENILDSHPYDLSGGEIQRAALAKLLLTKPDIILLDEPTKGLDSDFCEKLTEILKALSEKGTTIITVSHDIEFCALISHRVGMFFNGSIITEGTPYEVLGQNCFYTTSASRMAEGTIDNVLLCSDLIFALNGKEEDIAPPQEKSILPPKSELPPTPPKKKSSGKTRISLITSLVMIFATILFGTYFFDDRKYYLISLLIISETLIPFFISFEKRKPQAKEIVTVAVLCAIAVAGRTVFYMLPQFKPVIALVIISAVAFGGETGFLVGSITAFVSNFFFGQGPWTPWQMFALGIIGLLAGVLFKKGFLPRTRLSLALFGAISTIVIYGGIMNPASVLMWQPHPTWQMIASAMLLGLPMDIVHAFSTVLFLFFISKPMLKKLDRIKTKYGLLTT